MFTIYRLNTQQNGAVKKKILILNSEQCCVLLTILVLLQIQRQEETRMIKTLNQTRLRMNK